MITKGELRLKPLSIDHKDGFMDMKTGVRVGKLFVCFFFSAEGVNGLVWAKNYGEGRERYWNLKFATSSTLPLCFQSVY